ncbi:MAG: ATP-binding protein [Kiritimatiellae bacterium]|nr:ATP-binding protein [Kiritimatiellia bacterium]
MKLNNPFLTAGYAGPEYFCDRVEETRKLIAALKNDRNVTLIAPRRYGKTGLIRNAFAKLPSDWTGVYVDIYSAKNLAAFAKMLAGAVFGALDSRLEKAMSVLSTFFRSCRPTATPQGDGTVKFSFDITSDNAEASLKDVFDYLKARKRRVVIAIDEFQQVREFPEEGVEALLRSYTQFIPWVRFFFAGSRRHLMSEMFVMPQGAFYQSTQIMNLDVISPDSYLAFARGFFSSEGWKVDEGAFMRLYRRFGGVTWYVQAVLNKIWETRMSFLDDAQTDRAVTELYEERALIYHDLLNAQNEASQELVKAIARAGTVAEPTSAEFLSASGLRGASTVRAALKDLAAKDIAYRSESGWIVYDCLFAEYLRSIQ